MAEYSAYNRFPFHTKDKSVSISTDDHEDFQEMDFIYGKIVEKYPSLKAEPFYARIQEIQNMKSDDKVKYLKDASDRLLKNIRSFLSYEPFIHRMHD